MEQPEILKSLSSPIPTLCKNLTLPTTPFVHGCTTVLGNGMLPSHKKVKIVISRNVEKQQTIKTSQFCLLPSSTIFQRHHDITSHTMH